MADQQHDVLVDDEKHPSVEQFDVAHGKEGWIAQEAAARGQVASGYEKLTPWETVKTFKVATAICFAMAFSAATDGYQVAINASIIANKGFIQQFATEIGKDGAHALASPVLSGWGAIMSVGQIVGMISMSFVIARFGRKVAMFSYWLVMVGSVIGEVVSTTWEGWLVSKFLAGFAVGSVQTNVPSYISEVAPIRIRGGLLMAYSFWWTLGSFFANVALSDLNKRHPLLYHIPIHTQWAQLGLMLIIYLAVPESPAWCIGAGKDERAKTSLRFINRGVQDYDLDQQFTVLAMTIEHERFLDREQKKEKWYNIFHGVDGFRTLITMWTLVAQQFIGLSLFSTFGTYFFQQVGLADPFLVKVITNCIQICTVIVMITISDLFGRRLLACTGTTVCWAACIATGIVGVVPQTGVSTYIFILFACVWNIGLAINGATGWGYIGEISSQRLRPYTAAFGAAMSCLVGIIMNVLLPYMVNASRWGWGLKTGWFYVGLGGPVTLGMWFLIPETKGRSAAELDELFERRIKPWRFAKTQTATQRVIDA